MKTYQQSKLANLMLALELDRRLRAAGSNILSVAAHPGVANTNLFQTGDRSAIENAARKLLGHLIGAFLNTDAEGALPTLYAATASEAVGGGYYGPQGFQEMCGEKIGPAKIAPQARDHAAAARLWNICEELTGVTSFSKQIASRENSKIFSAPSLLSHILIPTTGHVATGIFQWNSVKPF